MNIVIATRNKNKKKELKDLLKTKKFSILTLDDLGKNIPHIVEDGKTFRQNAVKKAILTSKFAKGLIVADDSGLCVRALFGKPGVRSARFARTKATDDENNRKLLRLMKEVKKGKRQAEFVCSIAIAKNGNLLKVVERNCKGSISEKPKGKNGFGYDPLFMPDGYTKSFAQLSSSRKNKISHRGKALKKAKEFIQKGC